MNGASVDPCQGAPFDADSSCLSELHLVSDCASSTVCFGGDKITIRDDYWGEYRNGSLVTMQVPNFASRSEDVAFSLNGSQQCDEGYDGTACTLCQDNWYPSEPLNCKTCPSAGWVISFTLLFVSLKIGLAFYSAHSAGVKSLEEMEAEWAGSTLSSLFKVAVTHCSVLGLLDDTPWTWSIMKHITGGASHVGSVWDVGQTAYCFSALGFWDIYRFNSLLGPALLLVGLLCGLTCAARGRRIFAKDLGGLGFAAVFREATMTVLVVLAYTFLVKLIVTQFQVLSCFDLVPSVGDSSSLLAFNPTVSCWPEGYTGIAIILIVVYSAALCYLNGYVLYANRHRLDEFDVRIQYAFLYKGFTDKHYYWGFVLLMRRFALGVIGTLLPQSYNAVKSSCLVSVVLIVSTTVHTREQPFEQESINALESASLAIALLTILCSLYLRTSYNDFTHTSLEAESVTAFAAIANILLGE